VANKKITDVSIIQSLPDTDYIFVDDGEDVKKIPKNKLIEILETAEKVTLEPVTGMTATNVQAGIAELKNSTYNLTSEYVPSATYAVGNYSLYNGVLYRCTTAITTPEAWNSAHWTATKVMDEIAYPVGAIYLSVDSTSPAELFGGTWEQIKDTFLLACGDTYSAGSTGGEAKHKLTIGEMPSHSHDIYPLGDHFVSVWGASTDSTPAFDLSGIAKNYGGSTNHLIISNTGGNLPHNNLPPYLSVYMWKRIA
jgi:hypothetical protein